MGILWITLDVALAVLFLQWLGGVIDPNTFSLIMILVIVFVILHLARTVL